MTAPSASLSPSAPPAAPGTDSTRLLLDRLEEFFSTRAVTARATSLLVAVSGGADSTALLWGMTQLARSRPWSLAAAHLDHALDTGSAARAARVERLCASLDVPLRSARLPVAEERRRGESLEEAARRVRYRFLDRERRRGGARWVLTAHHADDQVETVLLRLLQGSGLAGLSGIAEQRRWLLRPLLRLRRSELRRCCDAARLVPVEDPGNHDLALARNRVRHHLIPALAERWPALRSELLAVAAAAAAARAPLEDRLAADLGVAAVAGGARLDRRRLAALEEPLWPFALAAACRRAGLRYGPGRACRRELRRQLRRGGRVGCDQGGGWRWVDRGEELLLARAPAKQSMAPFSYTFEVPGEVEMPELGLRLRLRPARFEEWMLRGETDRAGMRLQLRAGERVTVRNRTPGDRIRPLGCNHRRKLKDLLIERRLPRQRRDRTPLLEIAGRIVWVPGVTVDEGCRLAAGDEVWLAEIEAT